MTLPQKVNTGGSKVALSSETVLNGRFSAIAGRKLLPRRIATAHLVIASPDTIVPVSKALLSCPATILGRMMVWGKLLGLQPSTGRELTRFAMSSWCVCGTIESL